MCARWIDGHPRNQPMPRIVFLAVNDEFAAAMQRFVYERHPEWVVGSVISAHAIYKKTAPQAAWFVLRRSGVRYLAEMFRMKIVRRVSGQTSGELPATMARKHGVRLHVSRNINDHDSLQFLAGCEPDLVISTNFSHYIGKTARQVARYGTWNLHKSFLPHYRGMAPSFFAMLEGADFVGASLHVVESEFDTGGIIRQCRVPLRREDTVYSLNQRTSEAGGRLLVDLLEATAVDQIRAYPQPHGKWRSYSYPTRGEVKAFLRQGHRF